MTTTAPCLVKWCEEGNRPHTVHQHYAWSVVGTEPTNRRAVTAQALMFGTDPKAPRPALVLVDSVPGLPWLSVELEWRDADALGRVLTDLHRRFAS